MCGKKFVLVQIPLAFVQNTGIIILDKTLKATKTPRKSRRESAFRDGSFVLLSSQQGCCMLGVQDPGITAYPVKEGRTLFMRRLSECDEGAERLTAPRRPWDGGIFVVSQKRQRSTFLQVSGLQSRRVWSAALTSTSDGRKAEGRHAHSATR